ncbi:MAG: hypothetical protein ABIJ56_09715 [Pseudomonadota bacterium]
MRSAYSVFLLMLMVAIAAACGSDDTDTPLDGDADSTADPIDDGADMDADPAGDPDADPAPDPDIDPVPDPDAAEDGPEPDPVEDAPPEDAPGDIVDEDGPPPSLLGVHFYGNRGTWGSLGLNDEGTMWPDVDAVVARFASLCEQARIDAGMGEELRCGADVIGYAPTGYLPVTQEVVTRLITEHDARVTIDIRTRGSLSWAEVQAIVNNIFSGTSSIIDSDTLGAYPIGLSLDYEPQIVDGDYTYIPASVANNACATHRDLMTARGHDPGDLWCFLYEFGLPPMMGDGASLDPWIFPMLMSGTCGRTGDGDTPEEVEAALALKETWIDNVTEEYVNSDITGCMLFLAPYLTVTQSDQFSFPQALEAFGDKCDVYGFQ